MKHVLAAVFLLFGVSAANAACDPTNAVAGSVGCQTTIPGNMASGDYLLGWRPSQPKGLSLKVPPSSLLQAGLPGAFSTITGDTSAATITATGRSFSSTPAARAANRLNIKDDFGAKGVGTTDDAGAFTAVFALTGSNTVRIPCGSYLLSSAQHFQTTALLSLIGDSKDCVTLKFPVATAITTDILKWNGTGTVTISGFTIDLANVTAAALQDIITSITVNSVIRDIRIINGSEHMILLGLNNEAAGFTVRDNYLALSSAYTTQNQCINVSSSSTGSAGGRITGNTCVNSSMNINASHTEVSGNDISGWNFGAGITSAVSATSHDLIITNNRIHDGGTAKDSNNTASIAIENWAPYSSISNNLLWNNGAEGIDNGGQNSNIVGNNIWNNGTRADGGKACGISGRYTSSSINGNGSTITGNNTFDTGGGTQTYGYCDQTSSAAVNLGVNLFGGALGDVSILGTGTAYTNPTTNMQVFNASGTWTKPVSAKWVRVYSFPGGTGGAAGFACPNTTVCSGSSGPGGGSVGVWEGPASALTSTVAVTVGAAGTGGVPGGAVATQGGASAFGTYTLGGFPGGLGTVGIATTLTAGGAGSGINASGGSLSSTGSASSAFTGSAGGGSSAAGVSSNATPAQWGGSGAGAGGGIASGGVAGTGSNPSGNLAGFSTGSTATGANGAAGITSTTMAMGGGGFGGGAGVGAAAGNGGAGGCPGGPGGSGGDGYNGQTPGTGGAGCVGKVVVFTW